MNADHAPPRQAPTSPSWVALAVRGVSLVYLFTLAFLTLWVLVPTLVGWSPTVITSGSMRPAIQPGDVVIATPHQDRTLAPGTVVVFQPPDGGDELVTHRIVDLVDTPTAGRYRTQGDANDNPDSDLLTAQHIQGTGRLLIPGIGRPVVWLQQHQHPQTLGFALVTLLALAASFSAGPHPTPRPTPTPRRTPDTPTPRPAPAPTAAGAAAGVWTARHAPTPHAPTTRPAPTGPAPTRPAPAPPAPLQPTHQPGQSWTAGRRARRWTLGGGLLARATVTLLVLASLTTPGAHSALAATAASSADWTAQTLPVPPDVTGSQQCTTTDRDITIDWTAVATDHGADGYTIYRATTSGGPYDDHRATIDNLDTTSFTDNDLALDGETYYYIVRSARLTTTWESAPSTEAELTAC